MCDIQLCLDPYINSHGEQHKMQVNYLLQLLQQTRYLYHTYMNWRTVVTTTNKQPLDSSPRLIIIIISNFMFVSEWIGVWVCKKVVNFTHEESNCGEIFNYELWNEMEWYSFVAIIRNDKRFLCFVLCFSLLS